MTDWERTVRLTITAEFWAAGFFETNVHGSRLAHALCSLNSIQCRSR